MSDFLSNFTKNNYDGQKKEPSKKQPESEEAVAEEETTEEVVEKVVSEPTSESKKEPTEAPPTRQAKTKSTDEPPVSRFQTEETEFDPTYQKRQRRKYIFIGISVVLAAVALFFTYYQLTHVKVPNFVNKEISEVRAWGTEEGVVIKVDQEYDFDTDVNNVISQAVAPDKKIKKGKTLTIKGSLGADPEEKITLPDFKTMDKKAASDWITEHKAENITLLESFDNNVAKGEFIKQEAANKELKLDDYKRQDRLTIYYSKGKEVFEKDIEVPDFKGKPLSEVTDWTKKNDVKLKTEKDFSNDVAVDTVISQETSKGTKIAKQDEIVVHVSKGKAIVVPDYAMYTMEEASGIESKVPVIIKNLYSSDVPYGQFISQSVESGKEYTEDDTIPPVEVVYSQGRPYMKDLRGSTTEGDLPKLFFDEYQSKGAYIYYTVYYVDSSEPKGTVVEMSQYGQFLPIEATISIGISLGNLKPKVEEIPEFPETPTSETDEAATSMKSTEESVVSE